MQPLSTSLVAVVVVVFHLEAFHPALAASCPKFSGLFPNPDVPGCVSYINCWNWVAYTNTCPQGTVFNPNAQYCDWPFNYQCPTAQVTTTTKATTTTTKNPSTSFFPNPGDNQCRTYLSCSTEQCSTGLAFNPTTKKCATLGSFACSTGLRATSALSCPASNGLFPNPDDPTCSSFLNCANGNPGVTQCPPGTVFNPQAKYCDWAANYVCPSSNAGPPSDPNFTLIPYPGDSQCLSYLKCSSNALTCPSNQLFNPSKSSCDGSYQCPANPTTTTKATTTTKTTTQPTSSTTTQNNGGCSNKRVACYFPNWTTYRTGLAKHSIEELDVSICTHFIYSFAKLSTSTYTMVSFDPEADIVQNHYKDLVGLKSKNPKMKAIIALGGWTDSQDNKQTYKTMLSSASRRSTFINEAIKFMQLYGFDGLDLDYEFPDAADKPYFAALVKELRTAFNPYGFELSAAVSASPYYINEGLDVPVLSANLHAIHVMSYDLHGSWDNPKVAENHAPLYRRTWDTQALSVEDAVNTLINLGADPAKLVVGIPTYGRSFTVTGTKYQPPNVPFTTAGNQGAITQQTGYLGYQEICLNVKNSGWTMVDDANGPFAYKGNQWVGYDTVTSARAKANYINARNLGGAMFWETSTDDFNNRCGEGTYPIIRSVFNIINPCY